MAFCSSTTGALSSFLVSLDRKGRGNHHGVGGRDGESILQRNAKTRDLAALLLVFVRELCFFPNLDFQSARLFFLVEPFRGA